MKKSYLDYAMSVIVARAIPDVRDGLKPVQRRILVGMNELTWPRVQSRLPQVRENLRRTSRQIITRTAKPCLRPLVRLAQSFNMRYPLIDGQGNFGSVDGDPPAAMRYTEARLSRNRRGNSRRPRKRDRRFHSELRPDARRARRAALEESRICW